MEEMGLDKETITEFINSIDQNLGLVGNKQKEKENKKFNEMSNPRGFVNKIIERFGDI